MKKYCKPSILKGVTIMQLIKFTLDLRPYKNDNMDDLVASDAAVNTWNKRK